ncbi:MAG: hypothetical protein HF967_08695 [Methanosarcinales archaeon]|nr:hypothetical protein [Methanosarcinales archaeon]
MKKNTTKTAVYELKITKTNTLPFSKFEPHQLPALNKAKYGTLTHKISDMSLGYKPFDFCVWSGCLAYVAIMFYKPRQSKCCYLLDIQTVYKLKEMPGKRSISLKDCVKLGTKIYL